MAAAEGILGLLLMALTSQADNAAFDTRTQQDLCGLERLVEIAVV